MGGFALALGLGLLVPDGQLRNDTLNPNWNGRHLAINDSRCKGGLHASIVVARSSKVLRVEVAAPPKVDSR